MAAGFNSFVWPRPGAPLVAESVRRWVGSAAQLQQEEWQAARRLPHNLQTHQHPTKAPSPLGFSILMITKPAAALLHVLITFVLGTSHSKQRSIRMFGHRQVTDKACLEHWHVRPLWWCLLCWLLLAGT